MPPFWRRTVVMRIVEFYQAVGRLSIRITGALKAFLKESAQ